MNKRIDLKVTRRAFMVSTSSLLACYPLLGASAIFPMNEQKQDMQAEMTPEEIKKINQSGIAGHVKDFFNDSSDYSCAESMLLAFLRYHKKPEKLVWTAAGFGGGLGQRDLCGFLTGGIMSIGLAAGDLKLERKEAKTWCENKVKAYWEWWHTETPLHCKDILKLAAGRDVCTRLGLLAAVKLEELLKLAVSEEQLA